MSIYRTPPPVRQHDGQGVGMASRINLLWRRLKHGETPEERASAFRQLRELGLTPHGDRNA